MKNIYILTAIFGLITTACTTTGKKLSKQEIDYAVEAILDSNQVYEIEQSLRFSNESEQYNVLEYSRNDTVILYVETFTSQELEYTREIYYQNGKAIFINENGYRYINQENEEQYQQNRYFLSGTDSITYDKVIDFESPIEFKTIDNAQEVNYNKPINAINQEKNFEMKFGEFLTIEPQSFLILENKESQYNVALFITEGDFLLDELYGNQAKYKGTTIFAHHEFSTIGGIERMVYRGGILIEN